MNIVESIFCIFFLCLFATLFYFSLKIMIENRRNKKYSRELIKEINLNYEDFLPFYFDEKNKRVNETEWAINIIEKIKKLNELDPFWFILDSNEQVESLKKTIGKLRVLTSEYQVYNIDINNDIIENEKTWDYTIDNLSNFFVATTIAPFDKQKTIYCYTPKVFINNDGNLESVVFSDKESISERKIFKPTTHILRNMTKKEFYNIYINQRLSIMNFKNSKDADEYYEYMSNKFKNQ